MVSLLLLGTLLVLLLPSAEGLKCIECNPMGGGTPSCADYKPGVSKDAEWEKDCDDKHAGDNNQKSACVMNRGLGRNCMAENSPVPPGTLKCSNADYCNNAPGDDGGKPGGVTGAEEKKKSSGEKKRTQVEVGLLFFGIALAFLFRQMDIFGMEGNLSGLQ